MIQKNPCAHKNKIGTSPPPKKKQNTPPSKTRNFMGMEVFLQKERIFLGAHKIGAAISVPRTADKNFTEMRFFLNVLNEEEHIPNKERVQPYWGYRNSGSALESNSPVLLAGFKDFQPYCIGYTPKASYGNTAF